MIGGLVRLLVDCTLSVICLKQFSHGHANSSRCNVNANAQTNVRFCCDALGSWNAGPSACSCCGSREISNAMLIGNVWHDLPETENVHAGSREIFELPSGDARTCALCASECSDCVSRAYGMWMNVAVNGVTWNRRCRGGDCCEKPQGSC